MGKNNFLFLSFKKKLKFCFEKTNKFGFNSGFINKEKTKEIVKTIDEKPSDNKIKLVSSIIVKF